MVSDGETVVVGADASGTVDIPADASAVMWNLTIVNAYMTRLLVSGWPADRPRPETSVLNWTSPGEVRVAVITGVDTERLARFDSTTKATLPLARSGTSWPMSSATSPDGTDRSPTSPPTHSATHASISFRVIEMPGGIIGRSPL